MEGLPGVRAGEHPLELRPAVKSAEKVSFRQLDKKHHKPVKMERVSTVDGKTVEWDDIVKGL